MIPQYYILIGLIFLCTCCGLFIGYVVGKVLGASNESDRWHDRLYAGDLAPDQQDFDGGYQHDYQPRRLTSLTSRTTEN